MTRFASLGRDEERTLLGRAARTGQWFLGANPRTEPVPYMQRRLRQRGARLLAVIDEDVPEPIALAGYVPVHHGLHAVLDLLPFDGEASATMVDEMLAFLWNVERLGSFVKAVEHADAREGAFRACGFTDVGTLREHYFAGGSYHDQTLLQRFFESGSSR